MPHQKVIDDLEGPHSDLGDVKVDHLEDDQDVPFGRVKAPQTAGANGFDGGHSDEGVHALQGGEDEFLQQGLPSFIR